MNIGFYDPISERWIKPRPPKEPEEKPCVSLGETLLNAVEAAAEKERCDRIWKITRQVAEGVNAPTNGATSEPGPVYSPEYDGVVGPPIVVAVPPEYEQVFSLGFSYWKLKDAQCSGQQE
jgi:hypothetical protein